MDPRRSYVAVDYDVGPFAAITVGPQSTGGIDLRTSAGAPDLERISSFLLFFFYPALFITLVLLEMCKS